MGFWNRMNDNLCFPKICVYVCNIICDYYIRFEVQKLYVMVVFLRAQTYVYPDVDMECYVAYLSEELLDK